MKSVAEEMEQKAHRVARFLDEYYNANQATFQHLGTESDGALRSQGFVTLLESMRYSVLQDGGKRFRPALAMMTAEALGFSAERVLPYAAAVECIHTYSLIHDDLPCMDDDDIRRGQPTNHKKFGEPTALLAGDGLLTEAFHMISTSYAHEPAVGLMAVAELSKAAGTWGMVGGQAMDVAAQLHTDVAPNRSAVELIHRLKTGALIRSAAMGAGVLCFANAQQLADLKKYSECLGLAFQVTDDLLDYEPNHPESASYPGLIGVEQTRQFLAQLTEDCLTSLETWTTKAEPLRELARYNKSRVH